VIMRLIQSLRELRELADGEVLFVQDDRGQSLGFCQYSQFARFDYSLRVTGQMLICHATFFSHQACCLKSDLGTVRGWRVHVLDDEDLVNCLAVYTYLNDQVSHRIHESLEACKAKVRGNDVCCPDQDKSDLMMASAKWQQFVWTRVRHLVDLERDQLALLRS